MQDLTWDIRLKSVVANDFNRILDIEVELLFL